LLSNSRAEQTVPSAESLEKKNADLQDAKNTTKTH